MELNINGENIKLHFGMDFIETLDERVAKILNQNENEEVFGQGLVTFLQLALQGDYKSLATILYEATCTMESGRPSMKDIYGYIDDCDDLDKFTDEVLEELKKSGVCRKKAIQAENLYLESQEPTEESRPKRNTKK